MNYGRRIGISSDHSTKCSTTPLKAITLFKVKMAFKFVVFCATLAIANAGLLSGPVATYSSAPAVSSVYSSIGAPSILAHSAIPIGISSPAIGHSQQSTIRSLGGTVSQYSKAVDTAHSSVRKIDTRITNNGLAITPIAHQTLVAPAYTRTLVASPAIGHAGLVAAPAIGHAGLVAAPALASHTVVNHVSFDGLGAHYAW